MPDTKVLDTPMEWVTDTVRAAGGVTGNGGLFAINHSGDNGLITLRYRLRSADIQIAEEPFSSASVRTRCRNNSAGEHHDCDGNHHQTRH